MNISKNTIVLATTFAVGFFAGGFSSYFMTRNAFRAQTDAEVAAVKDYYRLLRKEDIPTPAQASNDPILDQTESIIVAEGYAANELGEEASISLLAVSGDSEAVESIAQNIESTLDQQYATKEQLEALGEKFLNRVFDRNVTLSAEELEQGVDAAFKVVRDPENPYVITQDDYMEGMGEGTGVEGYQKVTLTYYEGDDTLLHDDGEAPIEDIEGVIGRDNLEKFGVGNDNADTVYIRNEKMLSDFEVFRQDGDYATLVLGLDDEFLGNKEPKPRPQSMRSSDD